MSDTADFVYTTYINTTPERLWHAITDPAFSQRYLGHAMESDWKKGSSYIWVDHGLRIEHPEQVILESDPYRRLAFTFHTFVPELSSAVPALSKETVASAAAQRRSKVSFDIEPNGDQVKLTVIHGDFGPDSVIRPMISEGWTVKLNNLKTGLEAASR
jgi:uncharacterized protein YndB with AHSA1/START domain